MSIGLAFLKKVIDDGGPYMFLMESGLTRDSFTGDEVELIDFMEIHITNYNCLPSLETIKHATNIDLPIIPDEPLQYWADEVKKRKFHIATTDNVQEINRLLSEGNYKDLLEHIIKMGSSSIMSDKKSGYITDDAIGRQVLELHNKRMLRTNFDKADIPFGFPYIDSISDGIQPGDTVALAGKTGVGKSYLMCRMAIAAHRAGKSPLFISMEMSNVQIARRIIALRAGVNETRIRKGQLSTFIGLRSLEEQLNIQEQLPTSIHYVEGGLLLTVEDLALHIRTLKPDVVFIDGAYLLKSNKRYSSRWESIANSAEYLKTLSLDTGIPVVGSYQFNKEKDIGGSITIKQLASIVLALEDYTGDRPTWSAVDTKKLTIIKGRHGESGSITISYNMFNTSIEQKEVITGFLTPLDLREGDYDEED